MKKFQRFKQQGLEIMGRGERSDELTEKLVEIEKKVEGIRNGCQVTTKRLAATIQGSGSSADKHQRKLPHYSLGIGMQEAGAQLGDQSLFGSILTMVGQAEQDISSQQAQYEICVNMDVISALETMLAEDMKKVDKSRKKLHSARLDMDSAKGRLKSLEHQTERSSREYPMGKLDALRNDVDEAIRKFEDCQDTYATDMFGFLGKEQMYTEKLQQLVKQQISFYKQAATSLEHMLPLFDKKMSERQDQPVFGLSLQEHLRAHKCEIAVVIEECTSALRENWMDTEGLFRLAASAAKIKFLKSAFNAGQRDLSSHDPHTIAGCLKMYFRELPDPLLTYELYSEWMRAAGLADPNERLQELWKVKEKLPKANLDNFKYLIAFLREFAQYSESSKMNVGNIAIVFGPNLLWSETECTDAAGLVTNTAIQRRIAETFIENCHWFFPDLPPTPPPSLPPSKQFPTSPLPSSLTPVPVPVPVPTSPISSGKQPDFSPTPPPRQKEKEATPATSSPLPVHKPSPENMGTTAQPAGILSNSDSQSTPSEKPPPLETSPQVMQSENSTTPQAPPPTAPKPLPAPRPGSSGNKSTNPPSPAPKPRSNSTKSQQSPIPLARTRSNDSSPPRDRPGSVSSLPENFESTNGNSIPVSPPKASDTQESRPTPPTRTKRQPLEKKLGGRGPSRPAPPPPAKKPSVPITTTNNHQEEVSEL